MLQNEKDVMLLFQKLKRMKENHIQLKKAAHLQILAKLQWGRLAPKFRLVLVANDSFSLQLVIFLLVRNFFLLPASLLFYAIHCIFLPCTF